MIGIQSRMLGLDMEGNPERHPGFFIYIRKKSSQAYFFTVRDIWTI